MPDLCQPADIGYGRISNIDTNQGDHSVNAIDLPDFGKKRATYSFDSLSGCNTPMTVPQNTGL
jgi:hypothetical protein